MQNITVKNAAAADVVFAAVTPAKGYGDPAIYANQVGTSRAVYPSFTLMSDVSKARTSITKTKFKMPAYYSDPTTGLAVVTSTAEAHVDIRIPVDFPADKIADFAELAANLLKAQIVQATIKTGVPVVS